MPALLPLRSRLTPEHLETVPTLRRLGSASRALAELKGAAASIPRPEMLINTLGMQEAKDSSAIENIVTTHDDLYRDDLFPGESLHPGAKEVLRYREALRVGFDRVKGTGLLTCNHICEIQAAIEQNTAGFRRVPGTTLQDGTGRVIYTPPQEHSDIVELMGDLEVIINDPDALRVDPLIKMAVIHHQFESIHPFYDGNGRTGRIVNVLYLVKEGLLDFPILYHSRHIVRHKDQYYRLLQEVRKTGNWEQWILFMLEAVEAVSRETIATVEAIQGALLEYKHRIRDRHSFYSQDLINSLFTHPYTKIAFVERDLKVSRPTATKYLDALVADGLLEKRRAGRSNYYVNKALSDILTRPAMVDHSPQTEQ